MGHLFADRDLQTVVVGNAVERRGLQARRSIADVGHAERDVGAVVVVIPLTGWAALARYAVFTLWL